MIKGIVFVRKFEDYDLEKIVSFFKSKMLNNRKLDFVKGKKILLKPNLLGAYSPEKAVTTNPVIIEAIVILLKEFDCDIYIGDSPGGNVNYEHVCKETGIADIVNKYDLKLINMSTYGVSTYSVCSFEIAYSKIYDEIDYFINLPKYKTHSLLKYTGALKNLYGFVPGLKKTDYHRKYPNSKDFSRLLVELYNLVKPKLLFSVIDGIVGMEGKGPSGGEPRRFGYLMLSDVSSSLDYVASYMMGFNPLSIALIKGALHSDGILPSRIPSNFLWKQNVIPNVDTGIVTMRNKILNNIPSVVSFGFKKMFWYKPVIITDKCKKCKVCLNSCPVQAISEDVDGNLSIDYKKCIRCLCCHEFCTFNAIEIKKSYLARKIIPDDRSKNAKS